MSGLCFGVRFAVIASACLSLKSWMISPEWPPMSRAANSTKQPYCPTIDLCIKNAIIGVQEQNTYAQTERERRPTRRSAQASPGVAGFRLLSQRSGTAHWMLSKFGELVARYSERGRSQGFL